MYTHGHENDRNHEKSTWAYASFKSRFSFKNLQKNE